MAFEVPLEADRVDNLDFFSAILRAPVIGTLQWLLGDRGKDADAPEEPTTRPEALDDDKNTGPMDHNHTTTTMKRMKRAGALKKSAPSLIGSEISDIGEIRDSMDTLCLEHGDFYSGARYGSGSTFKSKKSLSWSDESGKELVENKVSHTVLSNKSNSYRWVRKKEPCHGQQSYGISRTATRFIEGQSKKPSLKA